MSKKKHLVNEENSITSCFISWLTQKTKHTYSDIENEETESSIIDTYCTDLDSNEKLQFQVAVADGETKKNTHTNMERFKKGNNFKCIDSKPIEWISSVIRSKNTNKYSPKEEEKTILLIKAPTTLLSHYDIVWPTNIKSNYKGIFLVNLPRMSSHPTRESNEGKIEIINDIVI